MKGPGIGPELSSASFPDEINDPSSSNLGRIIGTIDRSRVSHFEKILWRTLRGNLFMKQVEIDEWIIDPQTVLSSLPSLPSFPSLCFLSLLLSKERRCAKERFHDLLPGSQVQTKDRKDR